MTDDELKEMAEALVASTVEHGDPFDGHDRDTVEVARWALRLLGERDDLRAALVTISQWDCLNPPATQMCADLSWLKELVAAALLAGKGATC